MNHILFILLAFAFTSTSQAEIIGIGSWNTANRPNNSADDDSFSRILDAMGRPDVFAIQETDTASSQSILNIFNSGAAENPYQLLSTSSDSGGDRTGFVYNSSTLELTGFAELSAQLTHNIGRATFRSSMSASQESFTVYSVHLKAGNADATTRGMEASLIAADAAMLETKNVLFAGDFNLQSSNEPAWTNIDALDLANAPGEWRDNEAFKSLHTQNPAISMNDRFDLMFGSDRLSDGVGFEYLADSYGVFGNNGTHSLDGSITSGSGESQDVLNALAAASDHLPIFANFEFVAVPEPSGFAFAILLALAYGMRRAKQKP